VKRFVAIFLLALCSTGVAKSHRAVSSPTPAVTNSPVAKGGLVCRTKQQDLELRDWIGGLMNEVSKAKAETAAALKSNAETQAKLDASVKDATDLANECAGDKQCAKAPLSCWFHRLMRHLFWILGAVIVILIGLVVASFFFPALGPILGFFLSIWKRILGLFTPRPPPTP
jgi:hypothetical protein